MTEKFNNHQIIELKLSETELIIKNLKSKNSTKFFILNKNNNGKISRYLNNESYGIIAEC